MLNNLVHDPFEPPPSSVAAGTDGHLPPVTTEPPPQAPTCGPFTGMVHKTGAQRGDHRATGRPRVMAEPSDHCGGPTTAEVLAELRKEPG